MKFRKMASVLLAASLLIGCAAAENRTIFKKLSEEESMANEALPVEERADMSSYYIGIDYIYAMIHK